MSRVHTKPMKRLLVLFALFALLLSMVPMHLGAESGNDVPRVTERPTFQDLGRDLQPVPEEIQALFADGMTAEEFVALTGQVPHALQDFVDHDILVIIELEQEPAAVLYAELQAAPGVMSAEEITGAVQNRAAQLDAAQDAVMQAAIAANLVTQEISRYAHVYNGIQALVPANRIAELAALPGVQAVHRAPIHEPALGASVPLINAPDLWQMDLEGEGIVIAIIDTGIDYTHAALGGSGDPQEFADMDPNVIDPALFPTVKVIGGYDFAGTLYHAGCPPADEAAGICTRIPDPNPNPIDEHGHGTHVASVAAGIMADDVMPGTAPAAQLMALKVFGQSGSTALTMDALEWATISYMLTGYPQVINMSLGANFGTDDPTDPSVNASNNAAVTGIVVVASAGNAGNNNYITGSPATASKVLSVAATTTGFVTGPTVNVINTPPVTQTNIIYQPSSFDEGTGRYTEAVTATLSYVDNLDGADSNLCDISEVAENALQGQIALISRGVCAFSIKVNNAADLGAVGALIYNNVAGIIVMAGDPVTIPAASLQQQDGWNLIPAHGETVVVSAEDDVTTIPDPFTPADQIAIFSSRGPRGYDSALKPEVAAPGVAIFAAQMGTGTGGTSMSGTSMSAPHVAGVAALLRQAHPDWTPAEIKAAIMNTAVPLADATGLPRAGAGRVDAYAAATAGAVAIGDPDLISLSWGSVMSNEDAVTLTGTVTVHNKEAFEKGYQVDIDLQPGSMSAGVASLNVAPNYVIVPAGASASVDVTVELNMGEVAMAYGPALEEYFGFVSFMHATPVGADAVEAITTEGALYVPFYFTPKPFASLDIAGEGTIVNPLEDSALFTITHTGPVSSTLWVYPALYAAEAPNPNVRDMASVRMLGMDWVGAHPDFEDLIGVTINSWGPWHVPQPFFAEFDLYIDANRDGTWDYVNFNINFGWFQGTGHNNLWIVAQVDLSTGQIFLGSPWLIYTDYNNALMEWILPAAWQGLGPGDTDFDYRLISFDADGSPDVTPPGSFDYDYWLYPWALTDHPGPLGPVQYLAVFAMDQSGHDLAQPVGAMLVDYNGDPSSTDGAQAYLLDIEPWWYRYYLPPLAGMNAR